MVLQRALIKARLARPTPMSVSLAPGARPLFLFFSFFFLCLLFILQCSRGFLINLRTDSNEGEVEVGRKSTASTYPNGKPGTGGILPFLDMLRAREASGGLFDGCDCR